MGRDLSVRHFAPSPATTASEPPGVAALRAFFQHPDAPEVLRLLVMERSALPFTDDERERYAALQVLLTEPVRVALGRADVLTFAVDTYARKRAHFGNAALRDDLTGPDVREGLFLMAKHPVLGLTQAEHNRMSFLYERIVQARNARALPRGFGQSDRLM